MTSSAQVRRPRPVRVLVLWSREAPEPAGAHAHAPAVAEPGAESATGAPPEMPAERPPMHAPIQAPMHAPVHAPSAQPEPPAVREVLDALRAHGYAAVDVNAEEDMDRIAAALVVERPGIVLSLVDELYGDTTHVAALAAYLELLGVPVVGADHLCLATCPDRVRTRLLLADAGVPVPGFRTVRDINAVPSLDGLRTPVIVTQAFDDVYEYEGDERPLFAWREVVDRVATLATEYELPFLVEEYLAERRVLALVLGGGTLEVLPLIEAADEDDAPAGEDMPEEVDTAPWVLAQLDYDTADRIRELARRAFRALGCRDLARIDFHLDEDGRPHVVDVRALVDLGPQGPLYTAAESTERGFSGVVAEVVRLAWARAHAGADAPADADIPADAPADADVAPADATPAHDAETERGD